MKKNLCFFVAFLYAFISFAQKATFDIASYNVPKGWKQETKNAYISYTITNNAKNSYCIISIYASTISKGTAAVEFENDWKELAATPFSITEEPEINTATDDDGREVLSGTQNFSYNKGTSVAMLNTFVGFGRTTSVLALTNDNSYVSTIMGFLKTLSLKKSAPPVATLPKKNPANTTTANNNSTSISNNTASSSKPSNNLEGVWMALHSKILFIDKEAAGNPKWITFFSNGRVTRGVPDNGMNNYDTNDPNVGYYQTSNGKATLQWFKDVAPFPIEFINKSQITFEEPVSSDTYFHCVPVNGLKLQGTWTSFDNIHDPELDDNSKNRSMIAFAKDGSFTDYGVFVRDIFRPTPAGSGTYDMSNFALTLHYSTGTTYQTAFTGSLSLNPATNNQLIYIHRLAFHKR